MTAEFFRGHSDAFNVTVKVEPKEPPKATTDGINYNGIESVNEVAHRSLTILDIVARVLHMNRQDLIRDYCPYMFAPRTNSTRYTRKLIFSKPFPESVIDCTCPKDRHGKEMDCEECWKRFYDGGVVK